MPVDFFQKELVKVQTGFNQTFGAMPLCNPKLRVRVIFAIVQMGLLQRKISNHRRKEDISRFVKTRDRLSEIFTTLIHESKRRHHEGISKGTESEFQIKRA